MKGQNLHGLKGHPCMMTTSTGCWDPRKGEWHPRMGAAWCGESQPEWAMEGHPFGCGGGSSGHVRAKGHERAHTGDEVA